MTPLPGPPEPFDISFKGDALAMLTNAFTHYGDAFRLFSPSLSAHICVFSHPDHVRRVFVDNHANYTKGIGIERVRILLGNGIMASEGDFWRRQRKMIQPAFHRDNIADQTSHIRSTNLRLARKMARPRAARRQHQPDRGPQRRHAAHHPQGDFRRRLRRHRRHPRRQSVHAAGAGC